MADREVITAPAIRAKIIARELLHNATPREALISAGYSEGTVQNSQHQIISRPIVQNELAKAMAAAGITPAKLAQVARQGLDADKPVILDKSIVDYPDHNTRHKFLDTCVRLSGLEPANHTDIDTTSFEARIMGVIAAPSDGSAIGEAIDIIEDEATDTDYSI